MADFAAAQKRILERRAAREEALTLADKAQLQRDTPAPQGTQKHDRKAPRQDTTKTKIGSGLKAFHQENPEEAKGIAERTRKQHWAKKLEMFKEGGKSITFLSYDGLYGKIDKVLASVQ